jgi:hypothetical protein
MSTHTFITFGWRTGSIDDRAQQLQDVLGVQLEPRSSLYLGEYYRWDGTGSAEIVLQENFIEDDDGLRTHDRYSEHVLLLFATDLPEGWAERIAALDGVDPLRDR